MNLESKNWHVVTKTENGTVSILQNLTLREAVEIAKRLDPRSHRVSGQMYHVNGGDITRIEIIGPEGWDGCTKAATHDFHAKDPAYPAQLHCAHCGAFKHAPKLAAVG